LGKPETQEDQTHIQNADRDDLRGERIEHQGTGYDEEGNNGCASP
jgi:hypothetical protein